jgi:hypothetical protein
LSLKPSEEKFSHFFYLQIPFLAIFFKIKTRHIQCEKVKFPGLKSGSKSRESGSGSGSQKPGNFPDFGIGIGIPEQHYPAHFPRPNAQGKTLWRNRGICVVIVIVLPNGKLLTACPQGFSSGKTVLFIIEYIVFTHSWKHLKLMHFYFTYE